LMNVTTASVVEANDQITVESELTIFCEEEKNCDFDGISLFVEEEISSGRFDTKLQALRTAKCSACNKLGSLKVKGSSFSDAVVNIVAAPTLSPTSSPTSSESPSVSAKPSSQPSENPSQSDWPTSQPSENPSISGKPSSIPSESPSVSAKPSSQPSENPSISNWPTFQPSTNPSISGVPSSQVSNIKHALPLYSYTYSLNAKVVIIHISRISL